MDGDSGHKIEGPHFDSIFTEPFKELVSPESNLDWIGFLLDFFFLSTFIWDHVISKPWPFLMPLRSGWESNPRPLLLYPESSALDQDALPGFLLDLC